MKITKSGKQLAHGFMHFEQMFSPPPPSPMHEPVRIAMIKCGGIAIAITESEFNLLAEQFKVKKILR